MFCRSLELNAGRLHRNRSPNQWERGGRQIQPSAWHRPPVVRFPCSPAAFALTQLIPNSPAIARNYAGPKLLRARSCWSIQPDRRNPSNKAPDDEVGSNFRTVEKGEAAETKLAAAGNREGHISLPDETVGIVLPHTVRCKVDSRRDQVDRGVPRGSHRWADPGWRPELLPGTTRDFPTFRRGRFATANARTRRRSVPPLAGTNPKLRFENASLQ